jgi:hypothetical protein
MYQVLKNRGRLIVDVPCQLDKITVPSMVPFIKLFQSVIKLVFHVNVDMDKVQGVNPVQKDLGLVVRFSSVLDSLPTDYLRLVSKRSFHFFLTARYCMNEHVNKWAWSWIAVIKRQGFDIKTVRPCVMLYPLAILSKNYSSLVSAEERLSNISFLKYSGQLLCIVANRS